MRKSWKTNRLYMKIIKNDKAAFIIAYQTFMPIGVKIYSLQLLLKQISNAKKKRRRRS